MMLHKKLLLMERAARQAGDALLLKKGSRAQLKGYHDFVTEADYETEVLLKQMLLGACPEDVFYGEETGGEAQSGDGRFIVDPIDGTTNFMRGIPQYAVSIAYERAGVLELGAVYCPALREMFLARRGHGATLNGEPIAVAKTASAGEAIVGMSFAHRHPEANARMMRLLPELVPQLSDMRRLGSAALDLCYVACGRLDGFMELRLNLYDIAAGMLIVQESGGLATGWPGQPDAKETGDILAASPEIHRFLSDYLRGY